MKMQRLLRVGLTSLLVAGLLLMGLGLRPDAAHALAVLDFSLTRSPESVGSWYRPADDAIKSYDLGTVLSLEVPTSGDAIQSGTARIIDFSLPGVINNLGLYFAFTSVPSVIEGTIVVSGGQAEISFPDVSVDFERGNFAGNTNPGTLVFTLTTAGTTIPAGCAGRHADQEIPGTPLDLSTGALGLVASVCPYYVDYAGDPLEYDHAFRLALRGTVDLAPVPEPGTLALVSSGLLLGVAVTRRRR